MAWYERPTIFYDWVRHGEDLTPEYAQWVVQKTLDTHCDTLAFCVVVGGYALWDSQVTPRYQHLGEMDLIGELSRLCKQHNLHFVPWWLGTANGGVERLLIEHPSWQLVGPSVDGKPPPRHNYVCYNSPYRELIYEEVREVIEKYDLDGVYFDQLPGSCYCPWCQAKFEQRYGQPMPVVPDEFFVYNSPAGLPPLLKEFRDESVRSFCTGIRRIIDDLKPGICYAQNWVRNVQSHLAVGLVDVLLPEFYQETDLVPLGLRHRLTKTYFDHGAIWGNVRHSVRHDARHHPLRGTQLLLVDCVANLSAPVLLDLCAMDFDATGVEDLAATIDHVHAMQAIQDGAQSIRYAALLHSFDSHLHHRERFEEAFEGMYRLLLENHVPFDIVSEVGVQRGELAQYRVLVVPDAMALRDETVTQIHNAVANGLGLVVTFMSGLFDGQSGKRAQPALADILGLHLDDAVIYYVPEAITNDPVLSLPDIDGAIFHYGSLRSGHQLTHDLPGQGLFSFKGGFAVCTPADDAQVIADIHAVDQVRLNARPFNRRGHYPGPARWPLALVREYGKARVAYFAPQVEAEWRRAYAPELDTLLLRAVEWAGGDAPLNVVDCPKTVEVRLFANEALKCWHVMLVNLTTNPLIRAGADPAVVRYVTPHRDIRVALPVERAVKSVRSLIGTELVHQETNGVLNLEIPRLDLYESIVIEFV